VLVSPKNEPQHILISFAAEKLKTAVTILGYPPTIWRPVALQRTPGYWHQNPEPFGELLAIAVRKTKLLDVVESHLL
jgi:hypothetical protein